MQISCAHSDSPSTSHHLQALATTTYDSESLSLWHHSATVDSTLTTCPESATSSAAFCAAFESCRASWTLSEWTGCKLQWMLLLTGGITRKERLFSSTAAPWSARKCRTRAPRGSPRPCLRSSCHPSSQSPCTHAASHHRHCCAPSPCSLLPSLAPSRCNWTCRLPCCCTIWMPKSAALPVWTQPSHSSPTAETFDSWPTFLRLFEPI